MAADSRLKDFPSRLRAIRVSLLNFSMDVFAEKIGIHKNTVRSWESDKAKITPAFIRKLVEYLSNEGIRVNEEWLLYGHGHSPFENNPENNQAYFEEKTFLSSNPNGILLEVKSSDYEPFFYTEDLIGAIPIELENLPNMSTVILEETIGMREVRRIVYTKDNSFCFLPIKNDKSQKAIIYKPSMKVYKIIWFKAQTA